MCIEIKDNTCSGVKWCGGYSEPTLEGNTDDDVAESSNYSYDPHEPSFMRESLVNELERRALLRYNNNCINSKLRV